MSLAIVIGVGVPVNVTPNSVRKVRIDIEVLQLIFGRIPSPGLSFAKDGASQPIAFDRLMFHLATFAGDSSIQDDGPSLALGACIDIDSLTIDRADLK